jgi:hypothetical protein
LAVRSGVAFSLCIALLCGAALAGCGSPSTSKDGGLSEIDQGAAGLGVKATATTGVIRGVVIDEAIRPIANANVMLSSTGTNTTTNAQGAFGFEGLEPGSYFLSVSHPLFSTVQASADVVAGVDEPAITRVQLVAIPFAEPSYEVLHRQVFLTASACVGTCLSCCDFLFNSDVSTTYQGMFFSSANGTRFIQVLTIWDPTSDTAKGAFIRTWVYNPEDLVMSKDATQTGPVAIDYRTSVDEEFADPGGPLEVRGSIWARDPSSPASTGLAAQQSFDV